MAQVLELNCSSINRGTPVDVVLLDDMPHVSYILICICTYLKTTDESICIAERVFLPTFKWKFHA